MDEGPYRQSGALACPRCATSLVAEAGQVLACTAGCGAWYPPDVFAEELGPVMTSAGRPPSVWWKRKPVVACPACSADLEQIALAAATVHRCGKHGTWLDRGVREELERDFAEPLARHRESIALAALLVSRDPAALREFALRVVDLEHRIARLERAGY
jgi:hypothetical protein